MNAIKVVCRNPSNSLLSGFIQVSQRGAKPLTVAYDQVVGANAVEKAAEAAAHYVDTRLPNTGITGWGRLTSDVYVFTLKDLGDA